MIAQDPFTQSHAELLDGTYDVIDRVALNGYFVLGQSPGGFRTWWRRLFGHDEELDNAHLMRMAGRFSRRVRGWARANRIPLIDVRASERKCDLAKELRPAEDQPGIYTVLVGRAPAPVWDVVRHGSSPHLRRKLPWVNHYSFYIYDKEWGHLVIKISGHPPFAAQIVLNGHEWVACAARKQRLNFVKQDNCFVEISNGPALSRIAETLRSPGAIGRLRGVCDRWIYSCLCFGLTFEEQQQSQFRYSYSVYQIEYSRNLLFQRGARMDQLFQGVIDRNRACLQLKTVKTIFGFKHRPHYRNRIPRREIVVERPVYDLTIFKLHFGRLTLKMYTKGERVLRIEAIAHNTADLRCGKLLEKFPSIAEQLRLMLERFLDKLQAIDLGCIGPSTLDQLPQPGELGGRRVAGIHLHQRRIRAVFEAVLKLAPQPRGFTTSELAGAVSQILAQSYTPRQAAYDLRKLRGKSLVHRPDRSHRFQATPEGLRVISGVIVVLDKVLKPVLAGEGTPRRGRPPHRVTEIDRQYQLVRAEFRHLLEMTRLAA